MGTFINLKVKIYQIRILKNIILHLIQLEMLAKALKMTEIRSNRDMFTKSRYIFNTNHPRHSIYPPLGAISANTFSPYMGIIPLFGNEIDP